MATSIDKLARQERTRREILHKGELIAPLPDVVVRVLGLLNQSDTEPEDLDQHLRYDAVLVAKMLALVNSPFYGLNHSVRTVRDAIMVLGFRGLRSLMLASSTADYMKRDYSCYGHDDKGLFKHSIAVATGARDLARAVGCDAEAREELFVAGLLHDIGKMLVAPYLSERNVEIGPGDDVTAVEVAAIGVDHTEAGALVAAKWNLSGLVQEVLKHHHARVGDTAGDVRSAIAIVRVADRYAHSRGVGFVTGDGRRLSIDDELEVLGLHSDRWAEVQRVLDDSIDAALESIGGL